MANFPFEPAFCRSQMSVLSAIHRSVQTDYPAGSKTSAVSPLAVAISRRSSTIW
jgi:hypothetical protein